MKLQKNTLRVMCGSMALVLATVSAAAATADSLPPISAYSAPSDSLPQESSDSPAVAEPQPEEEQQETAYLGKKSETVYVNLNADGSVRESIVTDWLHSDTPGAELPDRTDIDGLTNVKGTETPQKEGDSLKWKLEGTDLYYRGTTSKPLPLEVSITYSMDGRELSPEEIAGKSGKMEMKLRFKNTTGNTVTVSGRQTTMHTPLMVIAGMSFSDDHFSNLQVSDGSVVADGNNQAVSIVCMPGLSESLGLGKYSLKEINDLDFPEEFTVTADAKEFEMGPVGIAVTTELPNLDEIKKSDDVDDMRRDLYDLQDMQDDLDRADPDRDLRSLITDPERTEAAQLLVDDIFTFYDLNKDMLDILPKYVTDENIKLYDRIKYDLKDSTLDALLDDDVVFDLLDRVDELSPAKLQSLADDFDKMDMKALRTLMSRCSELTSVFGTADAQKHVATLKKLAACREPMFALLGDVQTLNDAAFGQLLYASIVAKIPGAGPIEDASLKGLLKALLPSLSDDIDKDMAAGYTAAAGITSTDTGISARQQASSGTVSDVSSSAPDEADSSSSASVPDSESSSSGETSDTESQETEQSAAEPSEESGDEAQLTSVLAAYVESDEQDSSQPEDSLPEESEQTTEEADADEIESADLTPAVHELLADSSSTPRTKIISALGSVFSDSAKLDAVCDMLKDNPSFQPLIALRSHTNALKLAMAENGITSDDDLPAAMTFADSLLTKTESLQPLAEACFAPLVKNETDPAKKAQMIQKAMQQLTEDLATNQENFTSLILLMNQLKEEDLLDDIEYIDDLRKDMQDLRPIVKALNHDLKKSDINVSMHQSPKTTTTLLKMKDDLEKHRDISESLRWATLPKNVDIGRSMIETLDRLRAKDTVGSSLNKLDDADELLDRKEALVALSDQYRIFTDAPAELDTELKFIMKTDEIKAPEVEEEAVPAMEEKSGFLDWCKGLVSGITGK